MTVLFAGTRIFEPLNPVSTHDRGLMIQSPCVRGRNASPSFPIIYLYALCQFKIFTRFPFGSFLPLRVGILAVSLLHFETFPVTNHINDMMDPIRQ